MQHRAAGSLGCCCPGRMQHAAHKHLQGPTKRAACKRHGRMAARLAAYRVLRPQPLREVAPAPAQLRCGRGSVVRCRCDSAQAVHAQHHLRPGAGDGPTLTLPCSMSSCVPCCACTLTEHSPKGGFSPPVRCCTANHKYVRLDTAAAHSAWPHREAAQHWQATIPWASMYRRGGTPLPDQARPQTPPRPAPGCAAPARAPPAAARG